MSAYEIPNLRFSAPSGAAVARRRFVKINAQELGVQAGAGDAVIGVSSQPTTKANEVLEIYDGIVIVEAAVAIDAGTKVQSDAAGKAIIHDTGEIAGIAVTTATQAGELISIKL